MDIERRILELLYFKECVIIPGFGGFISSYIPASLMEESQRFYPPSRRIGFNPDLVQDDGILTNYISKTALVSIPEARKLVDEFHESILDQLNNSGSYLMKSIGEFSYARTGEIVFSANLEINFLPDSFGLSSIHFVRSEKKENPLLRTTVLRQGDKVKTIILPGVTSHERQKSIRRIAMAIPLLLAVSLLPINSRHSLKNEKNPASFMPLPSLNIQLNGTDPGVIEDSAGNDDVSSQISQPEESFDRNSFAIVAGSFSTEKNAQSLQNDLKDKGYPTEIWKATNGFFRVVIQAHNSIDDAQQAASKLKSTLPGIEFWVLQ